MQTLPSPTLFWDSDMTDLDIVKHARFIIERVLSRGDIEDFRWMKSTYDEEKIKSVVVENRTLDKRSQNFWCSYFNISPSICIRNQSNQAQSPFWTR
jgi:hypothetical protein